MGSAKIFTSVLGLLLIAFVGLNITAAEPSAPSPTVYEREGYQEVIVETRLAAYLFSTQGGVLRSAYLHFTPMKGWTKPAELIPDTETREDPQSGLERAYVRDALFPFRLVVDGIPTEELEHAIAYEQLDGRLLLSFTAELEGLEITKTFRISENPYYTLDFLLEVRNISDGEKRLAQGLQLFLGRGVGGEAQGEVRYLFEGEISDRPLERPLEGLGFVGGGVVFFLKAQGGDGPLLPLFGEPTGHERGLAVEAPQFALQPGESRVYSFKLYAGRAKYTLLAHEGLGRLAPPGFFSQFLIPVVQLLDWLYRMTGNYGWAIILFTLITRILLFPLTRKQFHSMAVMAELRPKLEKLQQRYPTLRRLRELHPNLSQEELIKRDRENRRALQEKMMELYRKEGVNPLGGCLPMLVQLPILIVLWQAILYSAEMIHLSPGFLWMSDLSLRDPYYLIVALTAIAMLLQTKTTPTLTTTTQGPNPMVFMIFSIAIMVLFLKDFPSGLWLYYFLTTIIQVGQQVFINWELKNIKLKKEAASAQAPTSDSKAEKGEA
jgi:YidC/Oxa1 family membrane protein insertase